VDLKKLNFGEKKILFCKKNRNFEEKINISTTMLSPGYSRVPSKNVSPFGPAVLPSIGDIQTNIYERRALLYRYTYIHMLAKAGQSAEPTGLTF